jgi:hypothetical protein
MLTATSDNSRRSAELARDDLRDAGSPRQTASTVDESNGSARRGRAQQVEIAIPSLACHPIE